MMQQIRVSIENEAKKIKASLSKLSSKNIHFAEARALTWTAKAVSEDLKEELNEDLTIRTGYAQRTIRIVPAYARDIHPTAYVGSFSAFMASLVTGGERPTREGRSAVPVPGGARPSKSDAIKRSEWPGRLLSKYTAYWRKSPEARSESYARTNGAPYDYFVGPLTRKLANPRGANKLAVYKITDRSYDVSWGASGPTRKQSQKLKMMYVLRDRSNPVDIHRDTWQLNDRATRAIQRHWQFYARRSILMELRDKGLL